MCARKTRDKVYVKFQGRQAMIYWIKGRDDKRDKTNQGKFQKEKRKTKERKEMACQQKERYKEMQEWAPNYINIPDTVISIRRLVPSKARVYCTWSKVRLCAMISQGMMGKKWMRANSKRWAVGIDLQDEWYRWPKCGHVPVMKN